MHNKNFLTICMYIHVHVHVLILVILFLLSLQPPEEEKGDKAAEGEEEEDEPIPVTPPPREWVCLGSDKEILEGMLKLTRPLVSNTDYQAQYVHVHKQIYVR